MANNIDPAKVVWDDEPTNAGKIVWDDGPKVPAESNMPWGEVAVNALANTPKSAIEYGKNILTPLIHPVDTVTGIRDLAFGGLGKIIPGADVGDQQQKFDAFRQMLADRYGGYENIKRTIATDPVGSLADVSSVLTGGGSLAAKLPGMAGKIGSTAAAAGRIAEPVNLVKQGVGGLAGALVPKDMPMRLYESALKPGAPTKRFTREQQLEALRAGLAEGVMPNAKGLTKVQDLIDGINDQIIGKIDDLGGKNVRIDTGQVVKGLDLATEFFGDLPGATKYIDEINTIKADVLQRHGNYIPIDQAQKIKQKIGTLIRREYGQLSSVATEARKGIAYGIKEEIQFMFPEIKDLNARESLMLRLEPMIEKAVSRIDKRDLIGIGTPIAGAAAGVVTGSPKAGLVALAAKSVMDNPGVKAYIAIALNKAKKGGMSPGFVEQRLAAYWAGKTTEQQPQ
jgi:hypothetical protein